MDSDVLSVLLNAGAPAANSMPGMQETLKKYLLNEWLCIIFLTTEVLSKVVQNKFGFKLDK